MDLEIIKPGANKRSQGMRKSGKFGNPLLHTSDGLFTNIKSRLNLWNFNSPDKSSIQLFSDFWCSFQFFNSEDKIRLKRGCSPFLFATKMHKVKNLIKVRLPPRDLVKYSHKVLHQDFWISFLSSPALPSLSKEKGEVNQNQF